MRRANNKGVALLWSLLLVVVLLIVSGTMADFIIKESRMTVNVENSTQAYANAKSGIDWGQKYIEDNPTVNTNSATVFNYGNSGTVTITLLLNQSPKLIQSLGVYNGAQRKIEYEISPAASGSEVFVDTPLNRTPEATSVGTNYGNFEMQFSLWKHTAGASERQYFGVDNSTIAGSATESIGVQIDASGYVFLNTMHGGVRTNDRVYKSDSTQLMLDTSSTWPEYTYTGYLKYRKGVGISLIIKVNDASGNNLVCTGSAFRETADDFGNLSTLDAEQSTPAADMSYDTTNLWLDGSLFRFDNIVIRGTAIVASVPHSLTTEISPAGVATPAAETIVNGGSTGTVSFSAPSAFYNFIGWSGNDPQCSGTNNPLTIIMGSSDITCQANFSAIEWIAGRSGTAMAGKQVYYTNIGPFAWGPYNVPCDGSECLLGIDSLFSSNYALVSPQSNPSITFDSYPAQRECKAIGGRLPYTDELAEILNGRVTYGNNFGDTYNTLYWTATEYDKGFARGNTAVSVGSEDGEMKDVGKSVRCVK